MNYDNLRKSAEAYVQDQIGVMRAHGDEPKLTKKEINGLVNSAEINLASIAGVKISKGKRSR
jgi:CTP:molybdopterin cytidylyltransferase MocA